MNKIIWADVAGTEEVATVGFRFQNIQFVSFPAPVTLKKKPLFFLIIKLKEGIDVLFSLTSYLLLLSVFRGLAWKNIDS